MKLRSNRTVFRLILGLDDLRLPYSWLKIPKVILFRTNIFLLNVNLSSWKSMWLRIFCSELNSKELNALL